LISKYAPECIIDIGANRGQFAEKLRAIGYKGRILSFEPVPEFFRELEGRAANDQFWEVYNCGLSSRSQAAEMSVYSDGSLSSLSEMNEFGASLLGQYAETKSRVSVTLKELDDWAPDFAGVSSIFIKLDTQGHDLEVLKGGTTILDRTTVVLSELSHQAIYREQGSGEDVVKFLQERGFSIERSFPVATDVGLRLVESDQFFLKEDLRDLGTAPSNAHDQVELPPA
jgi:FkbM family methyltransferase